MIKRASIGAAVLLAFGWSIGDACSPLPPPPELLPALPGEEPRDDMVPGIEQLGYEIRRATGTDSASCSDRGLVTVLITPGVWEAVPRVLRLPMRVAYEFQTVEVASTERTGPRISTKAIYPTSSTDGAYSFSFWWSDSSPAAQRKIEFTLSVTAVDRWGRRSEPCLLTLLHPGSGGEISVGRVSSCK